MPSNFPPRLPRGWRRPVAAGAALGLGLFGPGLLAQTPAAGQPVRLTQPRPDAPANGEKPAPRPAEPVVAARVTMPLAECRAIAIDRQPNVRAARASLAASQAGQRALCNMHPWSTVLAPDLPVRREQAARGVIVATAEVEKAERETAHDVAYLYYSYVYARQQEQTATDVIEQMEVFYDIARELLKQGPNPRVNQFNVYAMEEAITEVKGLRIEARTGQPLALAALKEAMGVDQALDLAPRDAELPVMSGTVTLEQVVELALSRRPELVQASAGVDAFRLEVAAQDKARGRSVPTLASGSDLHARQVPMGNRNGDYRPGALAPEMPVNLVGRREDRVARAAELSVRQDAVMDKTRELVRLEAINSYYAWKAATEKLDLAKTRFERSRKIVQLSRDNAQNLNYDVLIRNEALAGRAQADYLRAVFDHIKALLRLERVTAGGVLPAFPGR